MKKILLSLSMIAVVGVVVLGATGAFFSDTETSTGNTFTAGAIDLKVDNHSWYNGLECTDEGNQPGNFTWQGDAGGDSYLEDLVGESCESSWELSDLNGHLFFNFEDLKPGDWEEDTISLHVNNNDAWMCSTLAITSNDDNSSTEPELLENGEVEDIDGNEWDGELASALNFIFWADDGDNVLESDEQVVLSGTPADLIDDNGNSQTFPIADSDFSIFGDGPVAGDTTVYIGKAFCFGDLEQYPVYQGQQAGPVDNDPAVDPGFTCSGQLVNNITQTDGITGDLSFMAVQSRNNEAFTCDPSDDENIPT